MTWKVLLELIGKQSCTFSPASLNLYHHNVTLMEAQGINTPIFIMADNDNLLPKLPWMNCTKFLQYTPRTPPSSNQPPSIPSTTTTNTNTHTQTHILPFENYVTNHRIHILKNESRIDGIQLETWFETMIWEWTCASWGNGKAACPPACVSNSDTSVTRLKFQIKPSALERKGLKKKESQVPGWLMYVREM